jgi:lipoate-protein ligase A
VHAEYKVPGGKLVVVDLEVDQGRISECRMAGDFFLEPDEALEDINRAIVGLLASASGDDIADAVRGGLSPDVVMMGFSPEAVGTVVRRAITGATGFKDYRWEYIAPTALEPLQGSWRGAAGPNAQVLGVGQAGCGDWEFSVSQE